MMRSTSLLHRTVCTAGVALLLAILGSPAYGQDGTRDVSGDMSMATKNQVGISLASGVPVGEFSSAVNGGAFGVDLYYGRRVFDLPVYVGIDFGIASYGSTRFEAFGTSVTTRSLLIQPHASLRYQPPSGTLRPFAEALVGFNVLSTSTSFEDPNARPIADPDFQNRSSGTFSAGLGAGVTYRLYREKNVGVLGLTASLHYIYGGTANVPRVTGSQSGTTIESGTTTIQPKLGVAFDF
jgi:hypothetical protein